MRNHHKPMKISKITKSGSIKLPPESISHLSNTTHIGIKHTLSGITLVPYSIKKGITKKSIPRITDNGKNL